MAVYYLYFILLQDLLLVTCEAVLFGGIGLVNGDVSSTSTLQTPVLPERTKTTKANGGMTTVGKTQTNSDKSANLYTDSQNTMQKLYRSTTFPVELVPSETRAKIDVTKTEPRYTTTTKDKSKPTTKRILPVSSVGDVSKTTSIGSSVLPEKTKQELSTTRLYIPTKQPIPVTVAESISSHPTALTKLPTTATRKVMSSESKSKSPAAKTARTTVKVTDTKTTDNPSSVAHSVTTSTVSNETVTEVAYSITTRVNNASSKNTPTQTIVVTPSLNTSNSRTQVHNIVTYTASVTSLDTSAAKATTTVSTTQSVGSNVTKQSNETKIETPSAITFKESTTQRAISASATPASSDNATDVYNNSTVDPDRLRLVFTEDDTSDSFWPVVMALTIVLPSVVVFGVTITVLYRRRMAKPRRPFSGDYDQM